MSKNVQLPLFKEDIKVYGFLILIEPPKNVIDYVSIMKREIRDEFGSFESENSKAHITVSNFVVTQKRMDEVLSGINRRISRFSSFELRLQNFRTFESGNTFYIGVDQSHSFNCLINEFTSIKKEVVKTTRFFISDTPHLTIARKLNPKAIGELKKRYLEKPFYYTFDVKRLTVLTRSNSKEKYEFYSYINLQN